jgi:hypothetical protein
MADGFETRLADVEQSATFFREVGFKSVAELIGEQIADERKDIEAWTGGELRKAVEALSEKIGVEIAIWRSDLSDKIDIANFGGGLADEGLAHLKLAERAVAEVRAETRRTVAEMTSRLQAMERQLRQRDQAKAALLTKLAEERATKLELERTLAAKVDELAAENRRLSGEFEALIVALAEQGLIRPSEPVLLEAPGASEAA